MDAPRAPVPNMSLRDLNAWAQSFHLFAQSLRVSPGPGLHASSTPQGTTFSVKKQQTVKKGGSSTPAAPTPFLIADASTIGGTPAANVTLTWGHVQNIDPTMDGNLLSTNPSHNFTSAATYYGYLKTDGSTFVEIDWTTGAVPADTSSYTYCLIGVVVVATSGSGLKVTSVLNGIFNSFLVRLCNTSDWQWIALEAP